MRQPTAAIQSRGGLRAIALFEAGKGLLVLALGFGLLSALGKGVEEAAEELVLGLHLNPASRYPKIFIDAASAASTGQLWLLAALALGYAVLRFLEAYGLWRARRWAEWIAVASGAIYLPLEIYELASRVSWVRVGALLANLAIVLYMLALLHARRYDAVRGEKR